MKPLFWSKRGQIVNVRPGRGGPGLPAMRYARHWTCKKSPPIHGELFCPAIHFMPGAGLPIHGV
jgi:hypothetical protein